jgi:hypothetical protein
MRAWADAGIVQMDKGYVVVLNAVELEKLAGAVVY